MVVFEAEILAYEGRAVVGGKCEFLLVVDALGKVGGSRGFFAGSTGRFCRRGFGALGCLGDKIIAVGGVDVLHVVVASAANFGPFAGAVGIENDSLVS